MNTSHEAGLESGQHKRTERQRGFSLVELMVVITIIGILAGIAIPKFQTFRARAQQTEAKSGLNAIFLSAQSYEANIGDYPDLAAASAPGPKVEAVGFAAGGNRQRYKYSFISKPRGWAAFAISTQPVDGKFDYMRINTNKWLCSPFDAVSKISATERDQDTAVDGKDCPESITSSNAGGDSITPNLKNVADCPIGGPTCTFN